MRWLVQSIKQTRNDIARIARLTLPSCEVELKAFELFDLQGYVELLDNPPIHQSMNISTAVDVPTGLSPLSEPAANLQVLGEAC